MSDAGLERGLEQLGDGGGPPAAWQETVLARIAVAPAPPPRRRARWPLVIGGSGLVAAAAAVVLFVALRTPEGSAPAVHTHSGLEQLVREIDRLSVVKERATEKLARAVTAAERAEAERDLWQAAQKARAVGHALQKLKEKASRKRDDGAIVAKCDPNDPLCAVE